MFAAIARSYDLNNRLHSFWRDQAWRRATVKAANIASDDRVLDVACGTGDLTRAFADAKPASVTGLDFTAEMLDIARTRRLGPTRTADAQSNIINYVQGDAMALPFADASFNVVSIAFGLRNVSDPHAALRQFRRVLRPKGRVLILEFSKPRNSLIAWGNDLYTKRIMPLTATLIARDRSGAYRYLPRSVDTFWTPTQIREVLESTGLRVTLQKPMTLGVVTLTRAELL